jgi:hypothetical protein
MRYLDKNYASIKFSKNSTKYTVEVYSIQTNEVVMSRNFDFSYLTNVDLELKEHNKYILFIKS